MEATTIPILKEIAKRRSLRAFDPEKNVEEEKLALLFEAARWAPSAFNEQPWRFLVVKKNSEAYNTLFSTLIPANQSWVKNAPVLILLLAKKTSSYNGIANKHYAHDAGQAMAMLSIQATALKLNLHQMAGYYPEKVNELFSISDDFESLSITALGYTRSAEYLEEPYLSRETAIRVRKPINEIVQYNTFNNQ